MGWDWGGFLAGAVKGAGDIAQGWIKVEQDAELRREYAEIEAQKQAWIMGEQRRIVNEDRAEAGSIYEQGGRDGLLRKGRFEEATKVGRLEDSDWEKGHKTRELDSRIDYQDRQGDQNERRLDLDSVRVETDKARVGNESERIRQKDRYYDYLEQRPTKGSSSGGGSRPRKEEKPDFKWMDRAFTTESESGKPQVDNQAVLKAQNVAERLARRPIRDKQGNVMGTLGIKNANELLKDMAVKRGTEPFRTADPDALYQMAEDHFRSAVAAQAKEEPARGRTENATPAPITKAEPEPATESEPPPPVSSSYDSSANIDREARGGLLRSSVAPINLKNTFGPMTQRSNQQAKSNLEKKYGKDWEQKLGVR